MNCTGANCTAIIEAACESPKPAWGLLVGVLMGVAGSVGINTGQNMQANGIQKEEGAPTTRLWKIGLAVFASFSLVNFAALALAPASVLTSLESIQFCTNIAFNRLVNKKRITARMYGGVLLTMCGTVLAVVFGASGSSTHRGSHWEGDSGL